MFFYGSNQAMDKTRAQRIETILTQELQPSHLEIIDDSARHAGHTGSRPEGETHFCIKVASAKFAGKSTLEQHRAIYFLLARELQTGLHALTLKTSI